MATEQNKGGGIAPGTGKKAPHSKKIDDKCFDISRDAMSECRKLLSTAFVNLSSDNKIGSLIY